MAALVSAEDDLQTALAHAQFAVGIGARVGIVRETCGVIAYQAGDYKTAVRELRTALRITGTSEVLPMLADAERGLGRPERAFDIAASPEAEKLGLEGTIEMMIVVAGAYADTGDLQTALSSLEIPALRQKVEGKWQVRLWVAYSDLLDRMGRTEDARRWLTLAADADTDRLTDAADRLGRPAPIEPIDPTWYDAEEMHVLDAFDESAEDEVTDGEHTEPEAAEQVVAAPEAPEEEHTAPDVTEEETGAQGTSAHLAPEGEEPGSGNDGTEDRA